jgi:hypothetical protein
MECRTPRSMTITVDVKEKGEEKKLSNKNNKEKAVHK